MFYYSDDIECLGKMRHWVKHNEKIQQNHRCCCVFVVDVSVVTNVAYIIQSLSHWTHLFKLNLSQNKHTHFSFSCQYHFMSIVRKIEWDRFNARLIRMCQSEGNIDFKFIGESSVRLFVCWITNGIIDELNICIEPLHCSSNTLLFSHSLFYLRPLNHIIHSYKRAQLIKLSVSGWHFFAPFSLQIKFALKRNSVFISISTKSMFHLFWVRKVLVSLI